MMIKWFRAFCFLKTRLNDCNTIQHCWTMLHSVERGAQHLDSKVWDQTLPRILRNKPAPYSFAQKLTRDRLSSASDHLHTFSGLTVSLTPLRVLFLYEERPLEFKHSSSRDSKLSSFATRTEACKVSLGVCARSTMFNTGVKRMQHCCSHLRTKEMLDDVLKTMSYRKQAFFNIIQHHPTWWPNEYMLDDVASTCCFRLSRPLVI